MGCTGSENIITEKYKKKTEAERRIITSHKSLFEG